MKKIITALGNKNIYQELKKEESIQIISEDILYKEGILEILEKFSNVDFIILNSLLPGSIDLKELINKINYISRNIKIIIFLDEPNAEINEFLYNKKIYKIIYNNEIEFNDLIKIINNEKLNNEELKEEIEELKKIILNNEIKNKKTKKEKNKIKKIIKNNFNKLKTKNKKINKIKINKIKFNNIKKSNNINKNNSRIICILGPSGVGKSIITTNIAKTNIYLNNKILIIDFDLINNSINTILGIKKYSKKIIENNIEIFKEKINKKIDLIYFENILNNKKEINNIENIKKTINRFKNNYNYIFIDTNNSELLKYNKELINISDINLFISDTNLLEISKSIKLLDKYINKFEINKNKFYILFNKLNSESIDIKLLKQIFSEFNIIGYLKYNKKYNKLINKNNKYNLIDKKIRKEYLKINFEINNLIKKE